MIIAPDDIEIHKPDQQLEKKLNSKIIKNKILYKATSNFHDIEVVKNKCGVFLKYCDTYQAGYIKSKIYCGNLPYINYFLIPYLMNNNIKDILIIGFGSGIVVNQYELIFDKLKRIDIVDIEENIFSIAEKYFNFKKSDKMNFYLQDAIVYLKTTKKKYDLIVVDVANNDGIDERFCNSEYINLIKLRLKKDGIFVSNMPSSRDIFNKKNKFILELLKKYSLVFDNIKIFNGETSNKVYYKAFYDIDEPVYDITNLILISSQKNWKISNNYNAYEKIGIDISPYIQDLC